MIISEFDRNLLLENSVRILVVVLNWDLYKLITFINGIIPRAGL